MSDKYYYQASPKTPAGTLVNIQGDTLPEFTQNLQAFISSEAMQLIVQVENLVKAGGSAAPLVGTGQAPQPAFVPQGTPPAQFQQSQQQASVPQPEGLGGYCDHGPRRFKRDGVARSGPNAGKPYKLYECAQGRDDCKAKFVNG